MSDIGSYKNQEYISSRAAAKLYRVTHDHVARLARQGKIVGRLEGRNWMVEKRSLANFFADRTPAVVEPVAKEVAPVYLPAPIVPVSLPKPTLQQTLPAVDATPSRASFWVEYRLVVTGVVAGIALIVVAGIGLTRAMPGYFTPSSQSAALANAPLLGRIVGGVSDFFAGLFAPKVVTQVFYQQPVRSTATSTQVRQPATVVTNTYPVIERTVEHTVTNTVSGITQDYLNQQLNAIRSQIASISSGSAGVVLPYAPATRIDKLSSVAITGGSITNAAISGGSISGVSLNPADLSGIVAIANGGIGTSSAPSYGKVLLGNASGTYDLVATSSLGIVSGGGGNSFSYPFPQNATTTTLTLSGGFLTGTSTIGILNATSSASLASTTLSGNTLLTNATTTSFAISNITSSLLKTTSSGSIVAAVAGTDYVTGAGLASTYPFALAGNATSTLTQFNGGLTAYASSTIGAGGQTTGLTISGGATTTGNAYFASKIGIGTTNPQYSLDVLDSGSNGARIWNGLSGNNDIGQLILGNPSDQSQAAYFTYLSNGDNSLNIKTAYSVGTNNIISFSPGGVERVRFQQNGSVGVGTTSPWARLSADTASLATNAPSFVVGSSTRTDLVVTQAGSVGIGTASPSSNYTLDVAGPIRSQSGASGITVDNVTGSANATINLTGRNSGTGANAQIFANQLGGLVLLPASGSDQTLTINHASPVVGNTLGVYGKAAIGTAFYAQAAPANGLLVEGTAGIGTSSPFAKLSIHANNGDTATTLFAIGSSTASATTTLFSVSNTGSTTLYQLTSSLLKTNANGTIVAAIAGVDYAAGNVAFPFNPTTFGSTAANSTSTLIGFTNGIYALASSTIGNGTQIGGLTISGGATTTGNVNVFSFNRSPYINIGDNISFYTQLKHDSNTNTFSIQQINNAAVVLQPTGGNVSVGSTSPFAKFSIQANSNDTNTTLFAIGSSTASATTTLFAVKNNGFVGVNGISNPTAPLYVQEDGSSNGLVVQRNGVTSQYLALNVAGGAASAQLNGFSPSGNQKPLYIVNSVTGGAATAGSADIIFQIGQSGSEARVLTLQASTGNVGIGAPTPAAKLDISGGTTEGLRITNTNSTPFALMINNATYGSTDATGFGIYQANTGYTGFYLDNIQRLVLATSSAETHLSLGTNITDQGYPLYVRGTNSLGTIVAQNPTNTSWAQFAATNDQNAPSTRAAVFGYSGSASGQAVTNGISGEQGFQGTVGAYPFTFYTNNTARITIASSGNNVGIGTSTNLTAGGILNLATTNNHDALDIINTGSSNKTYTLYPSGNDLRLFEYSGAAGSAGNDRLTIQAGGNVGIGTTSPYRQLSVGNSAVFGGDVLAGSFTATSSATLASTTLTGSSLFTNATTTSFAISNISSGSILKTTTGGSVVAAVAGTDYVTGAGLASAYPFALAGNATSTLTQFNGGLTAFASSTIGNGTQTGGLTISGGATTTATSTLAGLLVTSGNVGIGTTSPYKTLSVGGDLVVGAAAAGGSLGSLYVPSLVSQSCIGTDATGRLQTGTCGGSLTGTQGQIAYFSGTNTAVGTSSLTISTAGNVGIGSTSPNTKLVVSTGANNDFSIGNVSGYNLVTFNGNQGTGGQRIFGGSNSDTGFYFENLGAGDLIFRTSSSVLERMRITNGGNVGVGSTTPWARLSADTSSLAAGVPSFVVGSSTRTDLVVTQAGNVGIGTSTTLSTLTISGAVNNQLDIGTASAGAPRSYFVTDGGGNAYWDVNRQTSNGRFDSTTNTHARLTMSAGNGAGFISFATSNTNNIQAPEVMRITGSGNVGIGTTSPTAALEVGRNQAGAPFGITLTAGSTVAAPTFTFNYADAGTNLKKWTLFNDISGGFNIAQQNDSPSTNNVKIYITNGGNVGIGTTSPAQALSVTGRVYTTSGIQFPDGTLQTSAAGAATITGSTGQVAYFQAGNSPVGTSSLTISTAGNVSIANTKALQYNSVNALIASTTLGNFFFGNAGNLTSLTNAAVQNTAVGSSSLSQLTSGFWNNALGAYALSVNTSGDYNNAVGYQALYSATTANSNNAFGAFALASTTTGAENVAIGGRALGQNTTGWYNVAIGNNTSYQANATGTVAVGFDSLLNNLTGNYNTAIGYNSLASETAGDHNTAVGYNSGLFLTTGYGNTLLGRFAGGPLTTGFNNLALGYYAYVPNAAGNNQLNVGNIIFGTLPATSTTASNANTLILPTSGSIGIGSTSPFAKFAIHTNNGDTATTLFAIGSSTATATSTLFAVSNTGNAILGGGSPIVNSVSGTHTLSVQGQSARGIVSLSNPSDTGADSDVLGQLDFYAGSTNYQAAAVLASYTGTATSTSLRFYTSNGSGVGERVRIDPTGNVGVGTTSPSSIFSVAANSPRLFVYDTTGGSGGLRGPAYADFNSFGGDLLVGKEGGVGGNLMANDSGHAGFINVTDAFPLQFGTNNTTRATIDSNGLFGIGTTTPFGRLSVDTSSLAAGVPEFAVGSSTRTDLYIDQNGYVAIGTTTPNGNTFTVVGSVPTLGASMAKIITIGSLNGYGLLLDGQGSGNNNFGFARNGVNKAGFTYDSRGFFGIANLTYTASDFLFRINDDGSLTYNDAGSAGAPERFRINANGNVGLSTSTPFGKFAINLNSTDAAYPNNNAFIIASSTNNATTTLFVVKNNGYASIGSTSPTLFTGSTNAMLSIVGSTNPLVALTNTTSGRQWALYSGSDGNFNVFESNTTQNRFSIASTTGNVGIGVTPGQNQRLWVAGSTGAFSTVAIQNTSNATGNAGLVVGVGPNSSDTTSSLVQFYDSGFNTVQGTITRNGAANVLYGNTSDRRLKENISTSTAGLSTLLQISVDDYNYIVDPTKARQQGFIAQDLYKVYPYAVSTNGDDGTVSLASTSRPWQVDYGRITPLIVKAVQDLNFKVDQNASSSVQISDGVITLSSVPTTTVAIGTSTWAIATSSATGTLPIFSISAPASSTPIVAINGTFVLNGQDVSYIASTSATTTPAQLVQGPLAVATDALKSAVGAAYGAIQNIAQIGVRNLGTAVYATVGSFNQLFTQTLVATNITADTVTANTKLCVGQTCVTEAQLQRLLSSPTSSSTPSTSPGQASTTPPVISINGNNPATITVGTTYSDLGATALDSVGNSLTVHTFLNGVAMDPITIDTSAVGTSTIDYVATDTWGNMATSTRTVVVRAATPVVVSSTNATSTTP